MTEKNRETLLSAIADLPQYRPAAGLWANIAEKLDAEAAYQEALAELPAYNPPAAVWDEIQAQLDKPVRTGITRLRVLRTLRAAAAVGLLAVAGWLIRERIAGPGYTITYGEVSVYQTQPDEDQQDEMLIETMLAEAGKSQVAEFPEFKALRTELAALNDAKAEVQQMMDRYGRNDEQLTVQLSDIEKQRTTVVKKMAEMI